MLLTAGDKLGPYEILSSLGAGGMSEVYKARDPRLDRTVAIKVMPKHIAARAVENHGLKCPSVRFEMIAWAKDIGMTQMGTASLGG